MPLVTFLVTAVLVVVTSVLQMSAHGLSVPGRIETTFQLVALPLSLAGALILARRRKRFGLLLLVSGAGVYTGPANYLHTALLVISGLLLAVLTAVAVAAVAVAPARSGLARLVDRLHHGQRAQLLAVVTRLARQLESALPPERVLPTIVDTLADALELPYAAIELCRDGGFDIACSRGRPTGQDVCYPLAYRGEPIGRLVLGPHVPFSRRDDVLMRDLATHAGVAVYAVRLTADLQRSRERLIAAREEERRRLRRDLHDGIGPALAGMAFRLEAMATVLPARPEEVGMLIGGVRTDMRQAMGEVRRLVEGLRPPALDELGLAGAIRAHADRLVGLVVTVEAPGQLPPLPAAVEVAVYRIATEALTNVIRHAAARRCAILLRVGDDVELEVIDDGRGLLPARRGRGFGLDSMRERAAELGGTCVTEPGPDAGTRVRLRLPVTLEVL